jgi:hypothetical protein
MIFEFDKKDPSGKIGAATREWRFRAISGDFFGYLGGRGFFPVKAAPTAVMRLATHY